MRLFLLMCLAAALIAVVNCKKGHKKNTIAGVNSKNRNRWKKNMFGRKYPNPWKKNTKFVRKEGDWNMYETHPDKQLEPMNVNPNLGAEIIIPRSGK